MEAVAHQVHRLKKSCGKGNAEWSELSVAITELADAVESLDSDDHAGAILDHLVPLAGELSELLRNIRSKLVSDVCEQLGRIVKTTRLAFTPLANGLLEALAGTAKASSMAIRNPGFQLFSDLSEYSRYDLQLVQRVYRSSPQERVKTLVLDQMQIVLTYWSKHDIAPFYGDMLEIMRRGMLDPSGHVRTACRQTFCSFSDIWHERLEELVDIPSQPARELLIKEKPHAAITKAIRRRFNIEAPKDSRTDSIRQRRTAIRRQGSSTVVEEIVVEVKESPRRPLQQAKVAEPSKRAPSPGRGPTRSASPSGATRTAVPSARAASPSAAARVASPSRPVMRGASPSRDTRELTHDTANGRAVSPGRSWISPGNTNGHASASPPARVRNSEFDRYLNSTMLEEKAPIVTFQEDTTKTKEPALPRPQKRVSILDPPAFSDSARSYHPLQPTFTSRLAQFETTTTSSPRDDSPHDFSQPSFSDPSSPPKTRFAEAAFEFVSRAQSGASALDSDFHEDQSRNIPSYNEYARPAHHNWTQPTSLADKDHHETVGQREIDSYLDRPIPSSTPAPEPRAAANVTQRSRRRLTHDPYTDTLLNETREREETPVLPSPTSQIKATHVPEREHTVVKRPTRHDLPRSSSDDEPPSVSIDSAFRAENMATAGAHYDEAVPPVSATNHGFADDDDFDKENVRDNNAHRQVQNAPPVAKKPDAMAKLEAIQAGVQMLQQARFNEATKGPKPSPSILDNLQPHAETTTPVAQSAVEQRIDDTRQQQHLVGTDVPYRTNRLTAPSPVVQADPPMVFATQRDQKSGAIPVKPVRTQEKPAPDFVRDPTAFRFASAAAPPVQQAQRVPARRSSPPTEGQVNQPSSRDHQHPDAHTQAFKSDRTAATTHRKYAIPPTSKATLSATPARTVEAPPSTQDVQRRVAHQDNKHEAAGFDALSNRPRHQQPFSLNNELPARPAHQTTATQSSRESPRAPASSESRSTEATLNRRQPVLNPKPDTIQVGVARKMIYSFCLVLGTIFGVSGLIQAATKVRDAYEYHNALLNRINQFETSIVESYDSVRKMDEKYSVWSEYVRELTEQDESNALHQLESIQVEVERWQIEMKNDLIEFKRSLSGDIIDAALAHLREPNTTTTETSPATTPTTT